MIKTIICCAGLSACVPGLAEAASFQGKLWLVPNQNGNLAATLPAPAGTPDATFTTSHLALFMNAPSTFNAPPKINDSVAGFLKSANPVSGLAFSGLVNSAVGGIVSSSTPVVNSTTASNGTYGAYIEYSGSIVLTKGEIIPVAHDDGASVYIDGVLTQGITASGGNALEYTSFNGVTGLHKVIVIYVNLFGNGLLAVGSNL